MKARDLLLGVCIRLSCILVRLRLDIFHSSSPATSTESVDRYPGQLFAHLPCFPPFPSTECGPVSDELLCTIVTLSGTTYAYTTYSSNEPHRLAKCVEFFCMQKQGQTCTPLGTDERLTVESFGFVSVRVTEVFPDSFALPCGYFPAFDILTTPDDAPPPPWRPIPAEVGRVAWYISRVCQCDVTEVGEAIAGFLEELRMELFLGYVSYS